MGYKAFISKWIEVYTGNEELFYRYQRIQANLMNSFLSAFPIKEGKTVIKYYGVEYVVTQVNFDEFTVKIESNPQQEIFYTNDDNEVLILDFESFIELFNEYHYIIE